MVGKSLCHLVKESVMKRFSALIAVAVAVALGAPTAASAQQPVTSAQPPTTSPQTVPVIDTTNQGAVYGWVDSCGRIHPYQTYSVSYQPVYTTRYYYSTPCRTVYYTQPSYYYRSSCCYSQPVYYSYSCCTARRSYRCCR
jgi:hypothetical protein